MNARKLHLQFISILLLGMPTTLFLPSCNPPPSTQNQDPIIDSGKVGTLPDTLKKTTLVNMDEEGYFYGVDLSKWNGNAVDQIDESDSLSFVICRATEGITMLDPDFASNCKMVREKNMILGAYHFYVCDDDAIKQVEHFLSAINAQGKIDIAPIVDIEELSLSKTTQVQTIQKNLFVFLNELEKRCGRKPMLYTDYSFANKYLKDPSLAQYPLWLAEYSGKPQPLVPTTWEKTGYKIWQKNDHFGLKSQAVDYDQFYGKKSDLCN